MISIRFFVIKSTDKIKINQSLKLRGAGISAAILHFKVGARVMVKKILISKINFSMYWLRK